MQKSTWAPGDRSKGDSELAIWTRASPESGDRHLSGASGPVRNSLPKFGFVVNKLNFHSLHTNRLFLEPVSKKKKGEQKERKGARAGR